MKFQFRIFKIMRQTYGLIPENSIVIAFTGWSRFWTDEMPIEI